MSVNNAIHLVKSIVNMAIFLEFTDEGSLNPDVAIEMMESIAAELQLLSDDDKEYVINIFNEISKEYKGDKESFIKSLPESFGLL